MSNNKQSSVDWFIEQLEEKGNAGANTSLRTVQISIDISDYIELKRQAKAMHKEEIVESWNNGYDEENRATSNPFNYYNEMYGSNK